MGICTWDIQLLESVIEPHFKSVIELGSQNLYTTSSPNPPFASTWYESKGLQYACIDLAGDNNASKYDLSVPIKDLGKFDIVTDFGTSEHVVQMEGYSNTAFHEGYINSIYPDKVKDIKKGFYNCWKNKHNLLNVDGICVSVNPKTGSWKGHGYSYYTQDFYHQLAAKMGYSLIRLGEHAAMGNTTDGWNVYCVFKKTEDKPFMSFKEFSKLEIKSE